MTLALMFVLMGCAARPAATGRVVIPHDCLISIEMNDKTECSGPDGKHVQCSPVTLTRKPGCEVYNVRKKEKQK